jgi:hypothetical protein
MLVLGYKRKSTEDTPQQKGNNEEHTQSAMT